MEFRYKTVREKVHERELYIAVLKRLESVLKGIKLELLKAKIKDLEAKQLIFESNKYL